MYSLVFFLCGLATGCKHPNKNISLIWNGDRAIAIQIPDGLIRDVSALRVKHSVKVMLSGEKGNQPIFGDFTLDGGMVTFQPLIPLSSGLSYDILQGDRLIGRIAVPQNKGEAPKLTAIYPETDTVPENLLKFYLQFSHPMRTGQVLDYICLLDKNKDTMQRVFLNLEPELWDKTGTVLTLWLDPGRIKRSLVLNRELGNPLKSNESYTLVVSQNWKDTRGISLAQSYTKHFTVGERDGVIPDINKWQISPPKSGTSGALMINVGQPLDHYLLQESISVWDDKGKAVDGQVTVGVKSRVWAFTPTNTWQPGHFQIQVKARLEDLAGNNLNRVFDRDITRDTQQNKDFFVRGFEVK